jgi:hypothetical protein
MDAQASGRLLLKLPTGREIIGELGSLASSNNSGARHVVGN